METQQPGGSRAALRHLPLHGEGDRMETIGRNRASPLFRYLPLHGEGDRMETNGYRETVEKPSLVNLPLHGEGDRMETRLG